ncbi:hypothetical protein EII34_06175 [Arachnia propionica]|uniref:Uncharacterized protein n=1 Tax=Arachnia propionica TaxID=1750 RepID=A0A3P1T8X7_9ACTN|nr:hypothetical protein [Arachnia propionica]MDO5082237.1 hypothetical protein [Arachnia propionica]RRD05790.1 hypothetical protein EII34_06175 [Arachnia propionica]
MAEIRTHDPDGGSEIRRLVMEALGEDIRPVQPGSTPEVVTEEPEVIVDPATLTPFDGPTISITDF